jgi:acyl carrier protein
MEMSRDDILEKVRETLVDALGVDDNEVQATSTLTGDLGAESIDFLDIVFRLEKAFGIQIPRGELFPDNILSNAEFVENGKVTAKGMEELKARMPHADFGNFESDPDINRMPDLFTVNTIVNYIDRKINS